MNWATVLGAFVGSALGCLVFTVCWATITSRRPVGLEVRVDELADELAQAYRARVERDPLGPAPKAVRLPRAGGRRVLSRVQCREVEAALARRGVDVRVR